MNREEYMRKRANEIKGHKSGCVVAYQSGGCTCGKGSSGYVQEPLEDDERIRIVRTYNWRCSVPPVCTAYWDDLDWAKQIGDRELIRARESGELLKD